MCHHGHAPIDEWITFLPKETANTTEGERERVTTSAGGRATVDLSGDRE
jgi:hypothetical protein